MEDPSEWVKDSPDWHGGWEAVREERAAQGFSFADWINYADYIAWVNIQALEKFKTGSGHPVYGEVKDMDDWIRVLDIMIDGFKAHLELSNGDYFVLGDTDETRKRAAAMENRQKRGMEYYGTYFSSLWD